MLKILLIITFIAIIVLSSIFVSDTVLNNIKKAITKFFKVLCLIIFGYFCFILLAKMCLTLYEACDSIEKKTALDDFSNYLEKNAVSEFVKYATKVR